MVSFAQNDSLRLDEKLQGKNGNEVKSPDLPKPLYFINGKQTNEAVVNELDPNTIESINVLKGEKAIEKYGESGKNGVIEINMKKQEVSFLDKLENSIYQIEINSNKAPEIIPVDSIQITSKQNFPGTVCQGSIRNNSMPNFVVDGELVSEDFLRSLDPNTIESINVLKSSSTVNLCKRGYDDTILITTKGSNYLKDDYDLAVLDLGYESFMAMQPSASSYSLNYLENKNNHYVSVWNSRVISGNKDIYEMPIDYDSRTYYGLDFEYKLFMFFKFMEDKHKISFI